MSDHSGTNEPSAALVPAGRPCAGNIPRGRLRRGGGFTVVELLVGLVLTVMILGAIALAVKGAADATKYGNEKTRSLAQATLALSRLCTDLRRADDIAMESTRSVLLTLPGGGQHRYWWSGEDGEALSYSPTGSPDEDRVLVPAVAAFSLVTVDEFSEIAGGVVPVLVQVTLEARCGQTTTRLETSVRPRRNIM